MLRYLCLLGLSLVIVPAASLHAQDIQLNTRYSYYADEEQGRLLIWGLDVRELQRIRLFRGNALLAEVQSETFDPVVLASSLEGLAPARPWYSMKV